MALKNNSISHRLLYRSAIASLTYCPVKCSRYNVRSIGMERASGFVGLVNLTYNLLRYEQVVRLDKISVPYGNKGNFNNLIISNIKKTTIKQIDLF